MRRKQGISLIVLVITIIVMIILAAAVVISLSSTNIINRANVAVEITNKKQVEDIATLAWAEAYIDGARTDEELEAAVEEAFKGIDTSKYTIVVTNKGVNVEEIKVDETKVWEYSYVCKNGVWSSKIMAGEELDGNIVVKFYKTNKKIQPTRIIYNSFDAIVPEDYAYEVVIEGSGTMGDLSDKLIPEYETSYAWLKELTDTMHNGATYCVMPYITKITIGKDITNLGAGAFVAAVSLESIDLGNIQSIGKTAINMCNNLKEIVIPDSVTTMGQSVFFRGDSLEKVTLSKKLTEIPVETFASCTKLKNIEIPEGVTIIKGYAFNTCTSLESIVIPKTVTSINERAFYNCPSLKTVYFTGTEAEWNSINIESANGALINATIICNYGK